MISIVAFNAMVVTCMLMAAPWPTIQYTGIHTIAPEITACRGKGTVFCCKNVILATLSEQYKTTHSTADFTSLVAIVMFVPPVRFEFFCGRKFVVPSAERTDVVGPFSMQCDDKKPMIWYAADQSEAKCVSKRDVPWRWTPPTIQWLSHAAAIARNVWGGDPVTSPHQQPGGAAGQGPPGSCSDGSCSRYVHTPALTEGAFLEVPQMLVVATFSSTLNVQL